MSTTLKIINAPSTQLNITNNVDKIVRIVTEGPQGPPGKDGDASTNAFHKIAQTIGDGTLTYYTITHGFNTRNVDVSLRRTGLPYTTGLVDWTPTTENTVTIGPFATPPAIDEWTVVVLA